MNKQIDRIESLIQNAIEALDRRIAEIVLETPTADRVRALENARNMRVKISLAFSEFSTEIDNVLLILNKAADDSFDYLLSEGVTTSMTGDEKAVVQAMIQNVRVEISGLSSAVSTKIADTVYMGAVTGRNKSYITDSIKQLLIGKTDRAGRPMMAYVKTIAGSAYAEIDAVVQLQVANRAGLKTFKYMGTLVAGSRPWCTQHVGKVFTLNEIKAWEKIKWAGKKDGDPFITRGGWNCRHIFRAVIPKRSK